MSFFQQFRSAFLDASGQVANFARASIRDLQATPTQVECDRCKIFLPVPSPDRFYDWSCASNHSNPKSANTCLSCQAPRPSEASQLRTVQCSCLHDVPVPMSNAKYYFTHAGSTTVRLVNEGKKSAETAYTTLTSPPPTFHCMHCKTLLAVPQGNWNCQTCTTFNESHADSCVFCTQLRSDQRALCGACRRSTKIPNMKIADSVSFAGHQVNQELRKLYYNALSRPFVTCPRCNAHMSAPENQPSQAKPIAQPSEEGKMQPATDEEPGSEEKKHAEGVSNSFPCSTCGLLLSLVPAGSSHPQLQQHDIEQQQPQQQHQQHQQHQQQEPSQQHQPQPQQLQLQQQQYQQQLQQQQPMMPSDPSVSPPAQISVIAL